MNKEFLILEAEAMKFVEEKHRPQSYGKYPYFFHLYMVNSVAVEFNLSEEIRLACWLHDILEDTATSYNDVKKLFGEKVADIVYLVTDEKGRNRKERHEKTYPLLAKNPDAIAVKLCDRIANVKFGLSSGGNKIEMYRKEHGEFVRHLYFATEEHHEHLLPLWLKLDSLLYSFRYDKK